MEINPLKITCVECISRLPTKRPEVVYLVDTTVDNKAVIFAAVKAGDCGNLL